MNKKLQWVVEESLKALTVYGALAVIGLIIALLWVWPAFRLFFIIGLIIQIVRW